MIKSMTGFGKSGCLCEGKTVFVEVRTLNSKTLDINIKVPGAYRPYEHELRAIISQHLTRGKVDMVIGFENGNGQPELAINKPLLEAYFLELSAMARGLGIAESSDLFPALLRLPEVFNQQNQTADDNEWKQVLTCIEDALVQTNTFRVSEGKHLEHDLKERILMIRKLLAQVEPLEGARKEAIKNKLIKGLNDITENIQHDPNRFEQELIYYLEKLDISEEKVRLDKHLEYFEETLDSDESSGKKLGFIAQEIGREINTIGSKANDAGIQKIVVQMKNELEKVKEQLMNIL
jgi:uncharacterized protein (TIGR00255 family)